MQTPQDEEIVRNLIDATEQLLQTLPNHVVDIGRPGQRPEADSHRSHQMKVVAYLIKQRNAAEFEEMEKRELETLYIMYLTNNRSFPDLPFNRKHIAINFTKYPQYVKCSFYDDRQKDVWNKFLEEYTSFK
ncbi:uncharacterized protein LOC110444961 [Mizuhopecten yessoensis]|uniref:Uncharacterized protein n=1 Tax=Mizuhopecten yessoensis TaxID=6573 RepID=A0A210PDH9_MIZYE|nr:uncharacterized protein LOC110444961 [Mizuhopecten yessoensis]OWF34532.1 hypothetical protein KP79_PYT03347 [Mizuhopecten yessoensis]